MASSTGSKESESRPSGAHFLADYHGISISPTPVSSHETTMKKFMDQVMVRMNKIEEELEEQKQKASSYAHEVLTMKREMIRISNESFDTRAKMLVLRESKYACKAVLETTELLEMILSGLSTVDLMVTVPRVNKRFKSTAEHSEILQRIQWKATSKTGKTLLPIQPTQWPQYFIPMVFEPILVNPSGPATSTIHIQGHLIHVSSLDGDLRVGIDLDTSQPVDYSQSFNNMRYHSLDSDTEVILQVTYEMTPDQDVIAEAFSARRNKTPKIIPKVKITRKAVPTDKMPQAKLYRVRIAAEVWTSAASIGGILRVAEEIRRGHPEDWPRRNGNLSKSGWAKQTHGEWAPGGITSLKGTDVDAIDAMLSVPLYTVDNQQPDSWYRAGCAGLE